MSVLFFLSISRLYVHIYVVFRLLVCCAFSWLSLLLRGCVVCVVCSWNDTPSAYDAGNMHNTSFACYHSFLRVCVDINN